VKLRFWIALVAQLLLFGSLNFFDDWTLEWMPVRFVGCAILCGLAYLIAVTEFEAIKQNAGRIFWVATVTLRLLALPLTPANEVWRFQADGVIERAGLNPYQVAPHSSELSGKIPELARIPRNDMPTAFAPGAEALLRIIPASNNALYYKLIFGAADLLAIALLLRLLDKQTAAWFAWNPLIAYSFFGAAHFDSIVLLAIIALIFCLERFAQATSSRWKFGFGSALALGVAIAIRPVCSVLLVPTFFALRRYSFALTAAIAVPLAFAFAFRFSFPADLFGDFGHVSRLNDLFWWLIEDTILPNWHQQHYRYDVIILIVSAAVACACARDWRRGMLWSLGAALIFAPVLHAWYVVWILPIATWRRAFAWHFLAVTIFAYYLFYNERLFALPWHAEPWLRGMIVLPVLFAMTVLALQRLQRPVAT
jgi:alpha-1,6-mannosyltransferase